MSWSILDKVPGLALLLPILFVLVVLLARTSVKILREYERAVVFQLGRFQRVRGPGLV